MRTLGRILFTWEWWGSPKYGWRFKIYRTAKGGWCVIFGAGYFTFRRVSRDGER